MFLALDGHAIAAWGLTGAIAVVVPILGVLAILDERRKQAQRLAADAERLARYASVPAPEEPWRLRQPPPETRVQLRDEGDASVAELAQPRGLYWVFPAILALTFGGPLVASGVLLIARGATAPANGLATSLGGIVTFVVGLAVANGITRIEEDVIALEAHPEEIVVRLSRLGGLVHRRVRLARGARFTASARHAHWLHDERRRQRRHAWVGPPRGVPFFLEIRGRWLARRLRVPSPEAGSWFAAELEAWRARTSAPA